MRLARCSCQSTSWHSPLRPLACSSAAGSGCPARWFRYYHLAHHRYTQNPERDPGLQSPRPEGLPAYSWHVLGWPTIASGIKTVLRNALQSLEEPWLPANQRAGVKRESRVMLALYTFSFALSVATSSSVLIEFWLLPWCSGNPFCGCT